MYTHKNLILKGGTPIREAKRTIILLHGRGGSAQDIISLQRHFNLEGMAIFAPEATGNSWYPYSFMAPVVQNQPALDSALGLIEDIEAEIEASGIMPDQIFFAGFSQGACLTLEYTARHVKRYGGIIALTGGLVGAELVEKNYQGDFHHTPLFISTGDPDPHVPVSRVEESIAIFQRLNAQVVSAIYPGRPHTISAAEIVLVNDKILMEKQIA